MNIAGVDLSSRALDFAVIDITSGDLRAIHRLELGPTLNESCATIGLEMRYVIARFELGQVWIEEPRTRFWNAAKALFPLLGAVAAASSPTPSFAMSVPEIRAELGLAQNRPKAYYQEAALKLTGVHLSEHAADAFLVGRAARSVQLRATTSQD